MRSQFLSWDITIQRRRHDVGSLTQIYDHLAPKWATKIQRLGTTQTYRRLFQRLQEREMLPQLSPQAKILDVGIGTGALSQALHRVEPGNWRVEGVDVSSAMLDQAAIQMKAQGMNFRLHQRNLCDLPFAPHRFDMVMSAHTLEHLVEPVSGLAALSKQLRPGAPLLLIITRRGWLGSLIDAKWGLTCPTPSQLLHWMQASGLVSSQLLPLPGRPWSRYMSLAVIGWRPMS